MNSNRRQHRIKQWLKEYDGLNVDKASKLDLFDAIRRYRTARLNVRCVLSRFDKSVTKAELIKKFNSSRRGAKRIIQNQG